MKVSVIIPTFERDDLICRAVDSVLAQTWKDLEIIIVDDNLPDSSWQKRTWERLQKYSDCPNIIYLRTAGKTGGGAARNYAIPKATGTYVAFLDDDDRFLPDKIEKQVLFMEEHQLDLSYQDVKWVDPNEKLVEHRRMDYPTDFSKNSLLKLHILHSLCPTSIYMIRRTELLKTEGFGETRSGQDFILMLRCIEQGMKIGYMPGAYVIQYLHKGKRISLGENKIHGENALYRLKHRYFHLLERKERRYVRFRHYAVLSFACMRSRKWIKALGYGVYTVTVSPLLCFREGLRYFSSKSARA